MANERTEDEELFEEIPSEEEDKEIDIASYKINTYGADYTLKGLSEKYEEDEIVIPPFQRKYVWPPKKASKLVESFLLGLPVPQIFLYKEEETQDLLVVDGQQRLKTIHYFLKGKFPDGNDFFLRSVKPKWEGKKFEDLIEPDKRRFKDSVLRTTIFQQTDPKDNSSIFEIFERLNTGGMALKEQEIRNCIVRGEINKFLIELNEYSNWRILFGKEDPDTRMRDVELILRFLAIYENLEKYSKPMKEFLTDYMRSKKNINEVDKEKYSSLFKQTMDLILNNIGPSAFKIRGGINVAVFDSISVALAKINNPSILNLRSKHDVLIKNPSFIECVSKATTDKEKVRRRIDIAIETFSK
jgi:uncharacterized protein with ParB-like and HNH nuclease domain